MLQYQGKLNQKPKFKWEVYAGATEGKHSSAYRLGGKKPWKAKNKSGTGKSDWESLLVIKEGNKKPSGRRVLSLMLLGRECETKRR